jgi:hypothetical protein
MATAPSTNDAPHLPTARLNSKRVLNRLFRTLPHELQCHPGRCARVRELHFVGGDGRDDPALIGAPTRFGNVLVSTLAWIVLVCSSSVYVPV